jgi:hypothetical protein
MGFTHDWPCHHYKPLQDQTQGLRDKKVGHAFYFQERKSTRCNIQDASWVSFSLPAKQ